MHKEKERDTSSLGKEARPAKITRREFLTKAALVGAGLAAVTSGIQCAPSATPTAPAEATPTTAPAVKGFKVLRFITDETSPPSIAVYKKAIAAFREERPDLDVDLILISGERAKLMRATTTFQTGGDMGIFVIPFGPAVEWARAGHLMELDDLIQDIGEDEFVPGARLIVDGHDYALPYQMNDYVLWYREDLLEKAGIQPPTNYEELLAAAQALTTDETYGIAIPSGDVPGLMMMFYTPTLWQSGLDWFDKKGNLTFDKPEALEATKRYLELMKYAPEGLYSADYGDVINSYIAEQSAMAVYAGRLGTRLDLQRPDLGEKTNVTGYPLGLKSSPLANKVFGGSNAYYFIHSKTAYPEESKEFLKFLLTGWRGVEFAQTVPGHVIPQIKSVQEEFLASDYEYGRKYGHWVKKLVELVPNATNTAMYMGSVEDGKFEKVFNPCPWAGPAFGADSPPGRMTGKVLLKGVPVEQAWEECVEEMRQIAEMWKSEHPDWKPEAG